VVDTHCHLTSCKPPASELVGRAVGAGVSRMLTVGLGLDSNPLALELAREHESVLACVGHHPNSAGEFDDEAAAAIEELAGDERVAAVGETGLDYYRDRAAADDQKRAFRAQIEIARRVAKPLVIHVRDGGQVSDGAALAETFEILADEAEGLAVILHCFSGTAGRATEAAARGWYCSFAGNATYPSAEALRESAAAVPDELLLVETDAPYLAPQPMRGKPNEPANVVETARVVAAERGVSYGELERLVEANAARVFGW
jgi:TatD DNase family protein